MNLQPRAQLGHDLPTTGGTHHGSSADLRRRSGDGLAGRFRFFQRRSKNKPFPPSWAPRLGVVFSSLAVAYVLLLCFRSIEAGRQQASPARSLAAGGYGPCRPSFVPGDAGGDSGATGGATQRFVQSLLQGQRMPPPQQALQFQGNVGLPRAGGYVAGQAVQGTSGDVSRKGSSTGNWKTQDLHLWAHWNMPSDDRKYLIRMLRQMLEATKLCASLLPVLTRKQQLQTAFQVVRLLALELGSFSLVSRDIEPMRIAVGDSLIQLAMQSLERSGDDKNREGDRALLRELIRLVNEVKQPWYVKREKAPHKYKKKMISIMATADVILRKCVGVLQGLLVFHEDSSLKKLPTEVVAQQLEVIKALYHVHANYVARDGSLRAHMLECQKRTRVYALFRHEHYELSRGRIVPVKELYTQVEEAVRVAGGLLRPEQESALGLDSAVDSTEGQTAEEDSKPEQLSEPLSPEPIQGALSQTIESSCESKTLAVSGEAVSGEAVSGEAAAEDSPQGKAPSPLAGRLPEQGASSGPALKPPPTGTFAEKDVEQSPPLVSTKASQSPVVPSVSGSSAAEQEVLVGHLDSSGLATPSQRPTYPSVTQKSGSANHASSSGQYSFPENSSSAHIAQSTAVLAMGAVAPSERLESPVSSKEKICNWMQTPAALEERDCGWLQTPATPTVQDHRRQQSTAPLEDEGYTWLHGIAPVQEEGYSVHDTAAPVQQEKWHWLPTLSHVQGEDYSGLQTTAPLQVKDHSGLQATATARQRDYVRPQTTAPVREEDYAWHNTSAFITDEYRWQQVPTLLQKGDDRQVQRTALFANEGYKWLQRTALTESENVLQHTAPCQLDVCRRQQTTALFERAQQNWLRAPALLQQYGVLQPTAVPQEGNWQQRITLPGEERNRWLQSPAPLQYYFYSGSQAPVAGKEEEDRGLLTRAHLPQKNAGGQQAGAPSLEGDKRPQAPAPQDAFYSFFSGGGVPPWSPFSQALAGAPNRSAAGNSEWFDTGSFGQDEALGSHPPKHTQISQQ
ncbi:hypothetical protein, conserved [Eimeria necatrix]|uniref:Uncharacterized protein n=1 Tax=Eimeria necatrix TaxID=51315 RepID=U6MEQ5_9EIME|nr:hypothetical protein, conserved [Eimeria necatrix]CDJ62717.1 hypothetical protein, conserved [Eimeria necatrix]